MRSFILALCLVFTAQIAIADRKDEILAALKAEGYVQIRVSETLLGRTRILATGAQGSREIVIDPRNGAVLRDYSRASETGQEGMDQAPRAAPSGAPAGKPMDRGPAPDRPDRDGGAPDRGPRSDGPQSADHGGPAGGPPN